MSNVIMLRNLGQREMAAIDQLKTYFHERAGSKAVMRAVVDYGINYELSVNRMQALNAIYVLASGIIDENVTQEHAVSTVVAIRKLARDQKVVLAKPSSGRSSRVNKI